MDKNTREILDRIGTETVKEWLKEKTADMPQEVTRLQELGYEPSWDDSSIKFNYKGYTVTYWRKKEWFSGKGVEDGRGFENLVSQIGENPDKTRKAREEILKRITKPVQKKNYNSKYVFKEDDMPF